MISFSKKLLFIHITKTAGDTLHHILHDYVCPFEVYQQEIQHSTIKYGMTYLGPNHCYFGKEIKHLRYSEYIWLYSHDLLDHFTKFTVVRNPFDRLLSLHLQYNNFEFDRDIFIKQITDNSETLWSVWNPMVLSVLNFDFNIPIHLDVRRTPWAAKCKDGVIKPVAPFDLVISEEIVFGHDDNSIRGSWIPPHSNMSKTPYLKPIIRNGEFEIIDNIFKFEDGIDKIMLFLESFDIDTPVIVPNINKSPEREHYSKFYDREMIKLVEEHYAGDLAIFNYEF
tara:strand:- start:12858 stop:13700 length:843 start_codon:yes stop_codon:yes gene_type:complete